MKAFVEKRKLLKLTQTQVAKVISVSQTYIAACEAGRIKPSSKVLLRWKQYLDISEDADDESFLLLESIRHGAESLNEEALRVIDNLIKYINSKR